MHKKVMNIHTATYINFNVTETKEEGIYVVMYNSEFVMWLVNSLIGAIATYQAYT